jgi:hypothetical protein
VKKLFGSFAGQNDEPKAGIYARPRPLTRYSGSAFAIYLFVSHLVSSFIKTLNIIANYKNFERMKIAGNTTTAIARICSQFIADFLQLGQRILHSFSILPQ